MSSSHDHHEHNSSEQKPVSFTVPFILAGAFLFILMLILSVCDPKKGHGECCKEGGKCSKECMEKCEKDKKDCKHEECDDDDDDDDDAKDGEKADTDSKEDKAPEGAEKKNTK